MINQTIFICSSSEALDVAEAIQENLSDDFTVEVWNKAFNLSEHYIESLINASNKYQYVLIVLTPDQEVGGKDSSVFLPKDNVIFEIGFCIGVFGRNRTFFIHESSKKNLKLPAYIDGLNYAKFSRPINSEIQLSAVLGAACAKIRKTIYSSKGKKSDIDDMIKKLIEGALIVVCRALALPLTPEEAQLRAFVFKKEDSKLTCTHFWSPQTISESLGISFEINSETKKQVAVVMAAEKKQVIATSVSELPDNIDGVNGKIDRRLCFILAAPILSPEGEVWGTIDFDASNERGENILHNVIAHNVIFELGRNLHWVFSGKI